MGRLKPTDSAMAEGGRPPSGLFDKRKQHKGQVPGQKRLESPWSFSEKGLSKLGKGGSWPTSSPVASLIGLEMAVLYLSIDLKASFFSWKR